MLPQAFSQLAEYVPATLTVILLVVAPVLQVNVPVQPVAVNVAVSLPQMLVLLVATVGAAGVEPVVMVITFDAPLVPQPLLHIALYVPAVLTVILEPVALVFHLTVPLQPVAVNVAVSLLHRLVLLVAIVGAFGVVPVVIVTTFDTPLVPQLLLHVAEYVPAVVTVILVPVALVLQVTVPVQPVAVKVAVSLLHRLDLLLAITGAFGVVPVVIVTTFDAPLVPQLLLHVAVYVPGAVTVILVPVALVLQVIGPAQPVAVKVAVSLLHRLDLLLAITGAFGVVPVVIVTTFDAPLVPQLLPHVAEYVPAAVTVILVPVALVLQVTVPAQPVAVNVAVSLLHRLVLLLAIVGAFGVVPVVIVITFDAPLVPQLLLQVAV